MRGRSEISRRKLLRSAVGAAAVAFMADAAWKGSPVIQPDAADATRIPLKIAHRADNMRMVGDFDVIRVARRIPGLMGVELQVAAGKPNLRDLDAVRRYKQEGNRWGMMLPSVAGVWDRGVTFASPEARANLLQSIQAGELLGVRCILVAALGKNCPDMSKESSYGPVVELLADVAREAAGAGIVLAIEASMDSENSRKLVDLIGRSNVGIYYDVYNSVLFGYAEDAIPGIKLLGKSRIFQVHVKNFAGRSEKPGESRLIEERGSLDWKAAFEALNEIGYDGWFVFETNHAGRAEMLQDTARNIAFLEKHCRMPLV